MTDSSSRYHLADFADIQGVPCPCGIARRAFQGVSEFPGTMHALKSAIQRRSTITKRLRKPTTFWNASQTQKWN